MLNKFGERVRMLREKKGVSLNAFAKKIKVSSAYLSNLETGKSDSIDLPILQKLQDELNIIPLYRMNESDNEISYRISRTSNQLNELYKNNPQAAEYLLSNFENGIEWFLKNQKNSIHEQMLF